VNAEKLTTEKTCNLGAATFGASGACVLLLHSSMSSRQQWAPLVERLQLRYRVLALDLFGYGQAAAAPSGAPFSLQTEVNRIYTVLDSVLSPDETVHVLGHAYGGAVALRFAYSAPGRVASVAAFEPVSFHLLGGNAEMLHDIERIALLVASAVELGADCPALRAHATRAYVDFWWGRGTYSSLSELRQQSLIRMLAKVNLDFQALFGEKLSLEHFRDLPIPVAMIVGRKSPPVTRQIVAALNEVLPWRETCWIDAGHQAPITDAHLVDPHFERHLDIVASQWPLFAESREWAINRTPSLHAR
jgi:pimeloyl-ACP methyl ester carboxylesterase